MYRIPRFSAGTDVLPEDDHPLSWLGPIIELEHTRLLLGGQRAEERQWDAVVRTHVPERLHCFLDLTLPCTYRSMSEFAKALRYEGGGFYQTR